MSNQDAKKRIITYLVIVFALSSIFYVLIANQEGGIENPSAAGYVLLLMWSPAVAGLVTTFIYQRNLRGMGWGLGKPKYYLIAFLAPVIYASIAYLSVWLLGLGEVDTSELSGTVLKASHSWCLIRRDFGRGRRDRLARFAGSPVSKNGNIYSNCHH